MLVGALVTAAIFVNPGTAQASESGCERDVAWAEMKPEWAGTLFALTNAHRASLGLPLVVPSGTLGAAAEWKAAHMAATGYFDHDDPEGRDWYARLKDCGYTSGAGENIAYGYRTPESVFQGWLDSPGHRTNIEDPDYRALGVGAAVDADGRPYWVQDFGTKADGAPAIEAPVVDEPILEEPVVEQPVTDQPIEEEPVADQPIDDQPVADQPSADRSDEEEAATPSTRRPPRRPVWRHWARRWRVPPRPLA